MQFIIGLVVFLIIIAISSAIAFGVAIGIVYALMWFLHDVLSLPYGAASSTAFALFLIGAVMWAIAIFFGVENKLVALFAAAYSLVMSPIMYAAAFNAHRVWTHAQVTGDSRYLPGEYWAYVSGIAGNVTNKLSEMVPALAGIFHTIEASPLLTGLVSSAFTMLVLTPIQQMMTAKQQRG